MWVSSYRLDITNIELLEYVWQLTNLRGPDAVGSPFISFSLVFDLRTFEEDLRGPAIDALTLLCLIVCVS